MEGKKITVWFFADDSGQRFIDINADDEIMVRINTVSAHKIAEQIQRAIIRVDEMTLGDKTRGQEAGE